jgi:DNA processing protein
MSLNHSPSTSLVGWVALSLIPRIGGRTLSALLDVFGSPRAIFEASFEDLLTVKRIGPKTIAAIQAIDLGEVEQQVKAWQRQRIALLTWQDSAYPEPFLTMPDRPPLLFARGKLGQNWNRTIAIVGTREPDPTSEHLAEAIGRELAARGWLVVSGLARGIDAAAHRGALLAGQTVAVLGCGVENIFPVQNRALADHILPTGAIYAEVPPGTLPTAGTLMARNRLITGLAKATIVIQAGIDSGAMEAARRARYQQRPVLTIDHPDYAGNQALIRMEAIPLPPVFHDWDGLSNLLDALPDPPRQLGLFE